MNLRALRPPWPTLFWLPSLAAIVSRLPVLGCGFAMDDAYNVVGNPEIRSLDAALSAFGHGLSAGDGGFLQALNAGYWRPLATLSWAIDAALFGLQPAAFHATNLLVHALCAGLLATWIRRLGVAPLAAALAASVWAVHAVHSETVALITYRTELLATACVLAGLAHAAGDARLGRPLPMALLFCAGVLCKESAAALPPLWALHAVLLRHRLPPTPGASSAASALARLRPLLPTFAALVSVGALWLWLRAGRASTTELPFLGGLPAEARLWTALAIQGLQASWLLLPWPQAVFWDLTMLPPALHASDPRALAGLLWLALLGATALGSARRRPLLALAAVTVVVGLLPTSQLVPLPVGAAERFLYLPTCGAALALALGLQRVARLGWRRADAASETEAPLTLLALLRLRPVTSAVLCAWVAMLCALATVRSADFEGDRSLAEAATRDHPEGFHGWHWLGRIALDANELDLARACFDRAAVILPGFAPNEALRAEVAARAQRQP